MDKSVTHKKQYLCIPWSVLQEKSKMDWDSFKKKEGIEEELKTHNKGKDGWEFQISWSTCGMYKSEMLQILLCDLCELEYYCPPLFYITFWDHAVDSKSHHRVELLFFQFLISPGIRVKFLIWNWTLYQNSSVWIEVDSWKVTFLMFSKLATCWR